MKVLKKHALYILLGVITGIICGLLGSVFSKSVGFVTDIRTKNNWILYLLPVGGLLSVGIYKLCAIKNVGTTNVFDSVRTEQRLPILLSPVIFCTTCISHLFGASAGREGAALQIGGGIADTLARIFRLDEDSRHITIMCGMAALFSAVFGTPLTAGFFVLEVIMTSLCLSAALPVLLSSFTAFATSQILHVHPERFNIGDIPHLSPMFLCKTLVITTVCIIVAFVFCKTLSIGKNFAKKIFKNEFLRIAIGGVIIIALTHLVGTLDYNGGGIDVIEHTFNGTVKYEAFALKLLFTVICVSCGYKGGEIIPTLFIGATLGGALGVILSLPIGTAAAIGIAVLFVCATKCPIATILLCGEMFGFYSVVLIAPIVLISFVAARYKGLYCNNKDIIQLIKS